MMKKKAKTSSDIPKLDKKTGLYKYPEVINSRSAKYFPMVKIIVDSEQSKEQILNAIEYIHNLECVNSDYMAVNSLMHLYLYPDAVEVRPDYDFNLGEPR